MIFKKNKKQKNSRRRLFRSYTDINNYNNFLLQLDKTSNDNKIANNQVKMDIEEENTNNEKQSSIDKLIQDIEKKFNEIGFNNSHFTGVSLLDGTLKNANNPDLCNKIIEPPKTKTDEPILEKIDIPTNINSIEDLINIIGQFPRNKRIKYNIDVDILHNIKEPLTELHHMIGMKHMKEHILDQILFYMQGMHINDATNNKTDPKNTDFMHTVIYGPPGTGKTEVAKIIGAIFAKMGILEKGTFKKVTRADLIAGYLGQTAIKTKDVIKEALGGVLFIDEAYALGNDEQRDSFSNECIDTLCEGLSDHK